MRLMVAVSSVIAVGLLACDGPAPTQLSHDGGDVVLSQSAEVCNNVRGTVTAAFVAGEDWDIQGTLYDDEGTAIGDAFAWIDGLEPRGDGAIATQMRHRYVIDGSALDTQDLGVLSPSAPPVFWFNNRLEVTGGTGVFSGAGGMIRSHGTVDLAGGGIELAYHGRVCTQ